MMETHTKTIKNNNQSDRSNKDFMGRHELSIPRHYCDDLDRFLKQSAQYLLRSNCSKQVDITLSLH